MESCGETFQDPQFFLVNYECKLSDFYFTTRIEFSFKAKILTLLPFQTCIIQTEISTTENLASTVSTTSGTHTKSSTDVSTAATTPENSPTSTIFQGNLA